MPKVTNLNNQINSIKLYLYSLCYITIVRRHFIETQSLTPPQKQATHYVYMILQKINYFNLTVHGKLCV